MLNSFSALSFAALTFTTLAGVHTVNGQEELKSGVHRLDLTKLQAQEEAFHRKLLADYLLEQEVEKQTSKQVLQPHRNGVVTQPQPVDPVLPSVKAVNPVQTPQPKKLTSLIPEVEAAQNTLARVFSGIISYEVTVSVDSYKKNAEQRLDLQDEEMQVLLTVLMEV